MSEQPVIRTRGLTRYFGAKAALVFQPAISPLPVESPREGVKDWEGLLVCLAAA